MGENLKNIREWHCLVANRLGAYLGLAQNEVGSDVVGVSEEDSSQHVLGITIILLHPAGICL